MTKKIKLFDPVISLQEELAVRKTLKSHFWASGAGTGKVSEFESEFKKYVKTNCCVAVNSGTAALHLALSLVGIQGKEVILPSLSFISTAHAIIYNGGIPIFVDVQPNTLCIDPEKIKESITPKTKVILPVHFSGMACELDKIKKICAESNSILIEDAAHAAGTFYKNKKIGSYGMAVCFSFHPVKNLAMPGGGAITLNGKNVDELERTLRSRRWCGISNRKGTKYNVNQLGWNYYMNEFSAAIGLVQLKKLDHMNTKRKRIAKRYYREIELEKKMSYSMDCSYHMYWIQTRNRNQFMKKLMENNIETGIHYRPIHTMEFYKCKLNLPYTEDASENIVSIPIHPNLTDSDVSKIIRLTNKFSQENP